MKSYGKTDNELVSSLKICDVRTFLVFPYIVYLSAARANYKLRLFLHGLVPVSRCVPTPLLIYQIIKFEYCTEVESRLILQR